MWLSVMRNKTIILNIGLCIVSLVIGILIGEMCIIPGLTIQKEINPVHAISIFTTILIAILVSIIFDKEKEKNNSEKQLIVNRINSALEIADLLHSKVAEKQIELSSAVSIIKRINITVSCIYKTLELVKLKVTPDKSECQGRIKDLNVSMTYTSVCDKGKPSPHIAVIKGILTYSPQRVSELETQIEHLKNMLLELQVHIIRN